MQQQEPQPRELRADMGYKKKTKGYLYGGSFWATKNTIAVCAHAKRLIRHFHSIRDFKSELLAVQDIHNILDAKWYKDKRTFSYHDFNLVDCQLLEPSIVSRGQEHNLKTSAGLELDNLTRAGVGGALLDWVGIGVGSAEPSRGSKELADEVTRIPVNPDGWLTPSSDLLYTGVIASQNTEEGLYKEAAGFTGNTADDVLGWICVLPTSEWIQHETGQTMMIWSHVEEEISLV